MTSEQHTGEFGGTIPGTRGRALPTKVGGGSNATRQRKAQARMSLMEATCGITLEQFDADMAAQRERVRARYGVGR